MIQFDCFCLNPLFIFEYRNPAENILSEHESEFLSLQLLQ